MTRVTCISKIHSFVRSSLHQGLGKWLAIGDAVVYYARAAHGFSAGIECRHSICREKEQTGHLPSKVE